MTDPQALREAVRLARMWCERYAVVRTDSGYRAVRIGEAERLWSERIVCRVTHTGEAF